MDPSNLDTLNNMGKIQVLLHEYATLRQEIITRTTHGFQLVAAGAVVLVWVMTRQELNVQFWFGAAIAILVVLIAIWFIIRDIGKAAKRIRELEKDINRRAGEELLVWETYWGGAVTGFWGRARPLPKNTHRSDDKGNA